MNLRKFLVAAATLIAAASAATAKTGTLYDCDLPGFAEGRGWVSPKVAIVVQADGTVKVIDGVIIDTQQVALSGTLLRNTNRTLTVGWTLRNIRAQSGRSYAHFDYRMSISKSSGKAELTAAPRSLQNGLRSLGTCRTQGA